MEKKYGNGNAELTFETWNERTFYKPGAVQNMIKEVEKYGLGVVVLQKIRWKETESIDISNIKIFFGECNERGQLRVGFAVRKNIVPTIKEFRVINPRLAYLKPNGLILYSLTYMYPWRTKYNKKKRIFILR